MRTLASGELTHQFHPKTRDELGQLQFELNKVSIGIVSIVKRIRQASLNVNEGVEGSSNALSEIYAGSEELGASVDEMSSGAAKQSALLTRSSGELERIAGQMSKIDHDVTNSQMILNQISQLVSEAGNSMGNVDKNMSNTVEVMNQFAENFNKLLQQVEQIQAWAMAIGEISNQTRMLSLNASIEAARAGEYGKGFSVVAEEIGKLSDETDNLTDRVREAMQELSTFMLTTKSTATEQEEAIRTSQKSLSELTADVAKVTDSFAELDKQMDKTKNEVKETQKFRDEILENVRGILQITEQFVAQVEDIRGASKHQTDQLLEISDAVQRLSGVFKLLSEELERFHVS